MANFKKKLTVLVFYHLLCDGYAELDVYPYKKSWNNMLFCRFFLLILIALKS